VPKDTSKIIENTPIIIPSVVRILLSLLASKDCQASDNKILISIIKS